MNFLKLKWIMGCLILSPIIGLSSEEMHASGESEKHVHGTHMECPLPKSTSDIISCSLSFHPSIKLGRLELDSATKLNEKLAQVPNPTISTKYLKGEEGRSAMETNLAFVIELGGKLSARKEYAQEIMRHQKVSNKILESNVKFETIIKLFRLRQVIVERSIIKKTIKAFAKVVGRLNNLPRLSAEQNTSLTLFEMALDEAKINDSELFQEERTLEHFFHISTGHSLDEIRTFLPPPVKVWPKVDEALRATSNEIEKLQSLSQIAQRELNIEKSNSWPDLKVGPSVSFSKSGETQEEMVGFNLQIPLPLFQRNGGARAYARSRFLKAQKGLSYARNEQEHERYEQLTIYKNSVATLKQTMRQADLDKKQKKVEKLYLRGVVSSSTFLDSLKQKLNYLKSRNHRELTAVKSLWSLYKINGTILKEKI